MLEPVARVPMLPELRLIHATLRVTMCNMIVSFRHKRLRKFYNYADKSGIMALHAPKLRRILSDLDVSTCDEDLS